MIDFIHLHVHTTYSMLDGYGLPWQYMERLKEIGHNAMGISDHGNIWGHVPFEKEAAKHNIKMIYGCEFYLTLKPAPEAIREQYHITVFAKNQTGLVNLHRLVTYSNVKGFYYKPRIDLGALYAHKEGLIVLSGCVGDGVLVRHKGNIEVVDPFLKQSKKEFGDDFYLEVSPSLDETFHHFIDYVFELSEEYKIKMVSATDAHFPKKSDHKAEDVMLCIGLKTDYNAPDRISIPKDLYLFDGEEAEHRCEVVYHGEKHVFNNTLEIYDKCDFVKHPQAKRKFYPTEIPKNELFRQVVWKGVDVKNYKSLSNWDEYEKRLEREMSIIEDKDYVDYFLIIWDIVNWAKKTMLIGPARGSVAGSLVAYTMGITQVDPIVHGLMFERFIDVSRLDDPDIDMDFPDYRRVDVINYIIDKYGAEHASLLGNLGKFKSKNALWDVRRIFNLPWNETKELAGMILERSSGDARSQYCLVDSFKEFDRAKEILAKHPQYLHAGDIEGQVRQSGIHAAAVVLTEDALENYSGCVRGREPGESVLSIDMYSMKYLKLLKIDILGLKQLTIFEQILKQIGKDDQWLYNLPLDDPNAYKLLRDKKYWGVFQFEGDAVRFTCGQASPDTFLNLSEISALARPGALHSGGTSDYLDRRAYVLGNTDRPTAKKPEYIHPLLEEIASETYGIIIYQEQVMRIMREIGGMSWSETTTARIGMGKSMGVEYFAQFKETFKSGAKENGVPEKDAENLWDAMQHFGSWAFNKSHSISYGLMSYWCLYFKHHYPNEFYCATLRAENDDNIIKKILREYVEGGGKFVLFDIDKSDINFTHKDGVLYGGWSNLKGIGEGAAEKLVKNKPWPNSETFRKTCGKRVLMVLKSLGALPESMPKLANQIDMFTGDIEKDDFGDVEAGEINAAAIAPWSILYPIGEKWAKHYSKTHTITTAIKVDDNTTNVVMIVRITDIQLYSMKEETMHDKSRQNYKNKELDRYIKLNTEDDTENMLMGVNRYKYESMGLQIIEAGVGSIMIIGGTKIPSYRKINIERMKILENG